jgi:Gram-negative bacterial TonB protein C-terminal
MALRPAAVLATVFCLFSFTARSQQASPVLVKDDDGGFSKQYKQIFAYYKKENYFGMTAAFQTFKLPPEWFVETFGAQAGPKLAQHYDYEFSFFVTETEKLYGPLNTAGVNFAETRRHKLDPKKPITAKPAPNPLKTIPPIQFFDVDYGSNRHTGTARGGSFTGQSWGNKSTGTFVYLDGAFRFFGPSTQPFWETLGTHTDENCQDSAPVPAIVSMRAFPLLPKAAEKLQLRRTVRVKVRVAADGHVIDVEPIDGDPMLIHAALDAARVWRYFPPWSKCGEPTEAIGYETIPFVLQ